MSSKSVVVRTALGALLAAMGAGSAVSVASAGPTLVVNTVTDTDDGVCNAAHCSLREALNAANASATASVISFAIPGAGPHTIAVGTALPQITKPVIIDGYTQPGAVANTNGPGLGSNATIKVRLDGITIGGLADGLVIAANDIKIRGLSITDFRGAGVRVASGAGAIIEGNFIGTDATGALDAGNFGPGVLLAASGATVGGAAPAGRNVLSGNRGAGVVIAEGTTGNQVLGNLIGVSKDGTAVLLNSSHGVNVQGIGNVVGGTAAGAGNVISGNNGAGVLVGFKSTGAVVQGNRIGTNAAGTGALPNVTHGVIVDGVNATLGGTAAGAGNVISGNKGTGILLPRETKNARIQGNIIGANSAGAGALPNERNGVTVFGADNIIGATDAGGKNTISGNNRDGVTLLRKATGNRLLGNHIGLGTGGAALPNTRDGVSVIGANNTIGGSTAGARNVISGNSQNGVELDCEASGNSLQGNYIGTNPAGTAAVGNRGFGVQVSGPGNTIGGSTAGAGNTISGNLRDGVELGCKATGSVVLGNYIGTNAAGAGAVPNAGSGVLVQLNGMLIGGPSAGDRNVISGNAGHGVFIPGAISGTAVLRNYIGTNAAGDAAVKNNGNGVLVDGDANAIGWSGGLGNLIAGNGANGIHLSPTANYNAVKGNAIGMNSAGTLAVANINGVMVQGTSNLIGGPTASDRNVVSGGAQHGVVLGVSASANLVQGNYLGLNTAGTGAIKNTSSGITLDGDGNQVISNVISGNGGNGVTLSGTADGNTLAGNVIGASPGGTAALANVANGLMINGTGNIIGGGTAAERNIVAGNGQHGMVLSGTATGNQVRGNYVGVGTPGTGLGNGSNGVVVQGDGNVIGGSATGLGNVISANGNGVVLEATASGNTLAGNTIGLTPDGSAALANRFNGVVVSGPDNTLGGLTAAAGNAISGNTQNGVLLATTSTGVKLQGNFIGTNAGGTAALGNRASGIVMQSSGNTIGGTEAGAGNTVAFNLKDGILVQDAAKQNQILGNRSYANTFMGIALGTDGITANDAGDGDTGANDKQNYPELAAVAVGGTTIGGTLRSTPNSAFRVELFSSNACDSSGFGEGERFLGAVSVTTNAAGVGTFSFTAPSAIAAGQQITSTATSTSLGNTSEFSRCVRAQ